MTNGFNQRTSIDYTKTFFSLLKPQTIRVVLNLALLKCWPLKQLDVQKAFLYSGLNEVVFMVQPFGLKFPLMLPLSANSRKALYDLKQTSRP